MDKIFGGENVYASTAPFFWSWGHIAFVAVAVIAIVLICYFGRKISHKTFRWVLLIFSIFLIISDFSVEMWQYKVHGYYDFYEYLPLHICSIVKYTMLLACFTKGKAQRCFIAYFATFGLIGGFMNFILPGVLRYYPIWHFRTFTSLFNHSIMVLIGVWSYTSGFFRPKLKDILYACIPFVVWSIPALIFNFVFDWDYMFFNGKYMVFAIVMKAVTKPVFVVLMYILYFLIPTAFTMPFYIYDRMHPSPNVDTSTLKVDTPNIVNNKEIDAPIKDTSKGSKE